MGSTYWKKFFNDSDWAEDEYYPRHVVLDRSDLAKSRTAGYNLPDDEEEENYDEFGIPAGYEYRGGWVYIGESKEIERDDFYYKLPEELKPEFRDLFIERNKLIVVRCPAYIIDGDNTLFFQLVFTYITRFRKIISIALLENMYEYLFYKFITRPELITRLNDKLIRIYYARRSEDDNIIKCEEKCREDIAFNLEYIPDYPKNLHSFKRLVILLINKEEYDEAKAFCRQAVQLELLDDTKAGYAGRIEKINKLIRKKEEDK